MNDSLDDFDILFGVKPGSEEYYDDNDGLPLTKGKPYQAHKLLTLNQQFMSDVQRLQNKYLGALDDHSRKYVRRDGDIYPPENELDNFYKDISTIANKIHAPGTWDYGVELFVLGYDPEVALIPRQRRSAILAKQQDGYVEVRIYGKASAANIRGVATDVAKKVRANILPSDTESSMKVRPSLDKYLALKRLRDSGLTLKQTAESLRHVQANAGPDTVNKQLGDLESMVNKIYQ